jgi:hypothetical protein
VVDEHELVNHALDTLLIDEGARKQQEVEQEKDESNSEDKDEGPQQEMNVVALVVTAERAGGSLRPTNRWQSLPNLDPSPGPSHNKAGSRSGSDSDDELNSTDSARTIRRNHVLLSGSSCPHLTMAQHARSAGALFRRALPASVNLSPSPIANTSSHTPLSTSVQEPLRARVLRADYLHQRLLCYKA